MKGGRQVPNSLPRELYAEEHCNRCNFCGRSFRTHHNQDADFCSSSCTTASKHAARAQQDFEYWAKKLEIA